MFVSDADMIACLDPAEIAVFCHRCIFAKHFITDFSTQGNTSITLTVRGFPEILPVFVCPGQPLFVSLFHSHNLTSGLFCGNFLLTPTLQVIEPIRFPPETEIIAFPGLIAFTRPFYLLLRPSDWMISTPSFRSFHYTQAALFFQHGVPHHMYSSTQYQRFVCFF